MLQYRRLQASSEIDDEKGSRNTFGEYSRPISPRRSRQKRGLSRLIVGAGIATLLVVGTAIHWNRAWPKEWLPTNFDNSSASAGNSFDAQLPFMLPTASSRILNGRDIDGQYKFLEQLSSGHEGSTSVYYDTQRQENVVIKRFTNRYRPLRNFLPRPLIGTFGTNAERWPTEVPATLLMGGRERGSYWSRMSTTLEGADSGCQHDFLPVYDYFLTRSDRDAQWQWRLVTPLVRNGTLPKLAARIRTRSHGITNPGTRVSVLHDTYRAAFYHLLDMLSTLHSRNLCHDDVKPTNVFVMDDTHWILADLGAVREVQHPLHRSSHWLHLQQWPDCRQNDVRRAIKVYLSFLREACMDARGSARAFDEQFMAGRESWTSMYWNYVTESDRDSLSLRESATKMSARTYFSGSEPGRWVLARWIWTDEQVRAYTVSQELHTSMMDSWRLWKLGDWLLLGSWRKERAVSVRL